jgi:hypothetical protein
MTPVLRRVPGKVRLRLVETTIEVLQKLETSPSYLQETYKAWYLVSSAFQKLC